MAEERLGVNIAQGMINSEKLTDSFLGIRQWHFLGVISVG